MEADTQRYDLLGFCLNKTESQLIMRILPGFEVLKQVVWNRELEKILELENADGVYTDPYTAFDRHKSAIETDIRWDNAERFTPFLEMCINRNSQGIYSYRVAFHSYDDLTAKEWKAIRDCVQEMLIEFESSKFGTHGRLFLPQADEDARLQKQSKMLQNQWQNRWSLSQQIRKLYRDLLDDIRKDLKEGADIERMSTKYKISLEKLHQSIYSTGTGNPTPSLLALMILEKSPEARALGIPDANRLYDEIISRSPGKEFQKRKKHTTGKRLNIIPKNTKEDII